MALVAILGLYFLMFHPPSVQWRFLQTSMLSMHLLLELFSIIIAMLIVAVSWHALPDKTDGSTRVLGAGFLLVAACDLVHALTYAGMPDLLGEASTPRAIFFWLMGRTAEVSTLGLLAMWRRPNVSRAWGLSIGMVLSCGVIWFGSYAIDTFPVTFVQGQGVTAFKAAYEYTLCAANWVVAVLLFQRARSGRYPHYYLLSTSAFVVGTGELAFTSYVSPSDFQNIFGHFYKVCAYALLYVAAFRTSIRAPYEALSQAEGRLKLAARSASIGIWDWDVLRNELIWDEQAYKIYGLSDRQALTFEDWVGTVEPDSKPLARQKFEASVQRGEGDCYMEFAIRRPNDGQRRILKAEWIVVRDPKGLPIRVVGANVDITEARQAEESIRLLNTELETRVHERTAQLTAANMALSTARDAAESATQAKSEFLANMSHEIRTPLNAVLGLTGLVLRSDLTPKQRDYLSKAQIAADTLVQLIDQILDFSKIEAGKLEIAALPFQLNEVLDKLAVIVGHRAQQKGLELLIGLEPSVPSSLIGDAQRLMQVLINLCGNAVKFTHTGEVTVKVSLVSRTASRCKLRIAVQDSGIGMTADQVQRLFQPFSQADESTSRHYGGTGLGLAISKELVERMGGQIGLNSTFGQGSEFYVTVDFDIDLNAASSTVVPVAALQGRRILVVDDSANARNIYGMLLRSLGCEVVLASSPDEGWDALVDMDSHTPFDLVFMDEKMHRVDGLEAARRIVHATDLKQIPKVIMVTAHGDEDAGQRAVSEGLNGCLHKPFSMMSLQNVLVATLTQPHRGQAIQVEAPSALPEAAWASLVGRRVLVVEDNEVNQLVATGLLGDVVGMHVSVASNGREALTMLSERLPDIVLMDVQMPGMDGYEVTRRIRQEPAWAQLPVIAMTAHAMAQDRERSRLAGMNDHVTKPFEPKELFRVIERWLPPREALAGDDVVPGHSS